MFLVGVDAFSKWPEVHAMLTTTAVATLEVLRERFHRHGIPRQLVTDNSTQFVSDIFSNFTKVNGIKHLRSALLPSCLDLERSVMRNSTSGKHQSASALDLESF